MKPEDIARLIDEGKITSKRELKSVAKSIKFTEIMKHVRKDSSKVFLQLKPTRSLSGVSVVAVMCAPHECPGKCIYCPKGENAPQSYTGNEPAAMRARRNDYDSFKQVRDRLSQYEITGHDTSKIEVIIMGGTFFSTPVEYQEGFIKGVYQALNETKTNDLSKLKAENETARHRCVAMTFETRPDYCSDEIIKRMISYGGTRCEVGLQSVYDSVLKNINRGHDTACVKDCIKRLKNAGLKVDLHVMPGLPGSNKEKDVGMFKVLFEDKNFRPDGLKIYPTLVMKGTVLFDLWKNGSYKALSDDEAVSIISEGLVFVPVYSRIKRVMRDIPINFASSGPRRSNLHELCLEKIECNCIRCRESGRNGKASEAVLSIYEYDASGGKEFFISFEDFKNKALVGFCRLRLEREALVRELHVYGITTKVGDAGSDLQHKGYGTKLLLEAEKIAQSKGYSRIKVLSGVGVRAYYKRRGYVLEGDYLSKKLSFPCY